MTKQEQIDKLGNTIIYLADRMENLSKTKLLKLIYLLDEYAVKKFGIPFFGFNYEVWRLGPVCQEVFAELNAEEEELTFLDRFITLDRQENTTYINGKSKFNDDEFSTNDLKLLEEVTTSFKNATANQLIDITHQKGSLWYNVALKNDLLEPFDNKFKNTSNHEIQFEELIKQDQVKANLYHDYKEFTNFTKAF